MERKIFLPDEFQYVVIGGTGWLGLSTLDHLKRKLGASFLREVVVFGSRSQELVLKTGESISVRSLSSLEEFKPHKPLLVLHYAFRTKDKVSTTSLESYLSENLQIRNAVFRFLERCNVAGLITPSSGAVYQYLDHQNTSESSVVYGKCKYEDEQIFSETAKKRGYRAVIPRVFNLGGPNINKVSHYALSSIILSCLSKTTIRLQATHPVWRSYYAVQDFLELVFRMIEDPDPDVPTSFDTAGDEVVEIGELAQRCRILLSKNGVIDVVRPFVQKEPNDYYVGTPETIRMLERRYHLTPQSLDHQICQTAGFLQTNI